MYTQQILIDIPNHQIFSQGEYTVFNGKGFWLLSRLITNPNILYTRENLISDLDIFDRTVDVWAVRARKILAKYGYKKQIESVRGLGYIYRHHQLIEVKR